MFSGVAHLVGQVWKVEPQKCCQSAQPSVWTFSEVLGFLFAILGEPSRVEISSARQLFVGLHPEAISFCQKAEKQSCDAFTFVQFSLENVERTKPLSEQEFLMDSVRDQAVIHVLSRTESHT